MSGRASTGKMAQSMALDMKDKGVGFRYLSPNPKVLFSSDKSTDCSQFTKQVYTSDHTGTYGQAPNTQSWFMR